MTSEAPRGGSCSSEEFKIRYLPFENVTWSLLKYALSGEDCSFDCFKQFLNQEEDSFFF